VLHDDFLCTFPIKTDAISKPGNAQAARGCFLSPLAPCAINLLPYKIRRETEEDMKRIEDIKKRAPRYFVWVANINEFNW